jgi:hypothetical protein
LSETINSAQKEYQSIFQYDNKRAIFECMAYKCLIWSISELLNCNVFVSFEEIVGELRVLE